MFRKMRRFKQQITEEQCIEVLKNAKRGVLSLIGEDGYPYGLPINQWYCEEDGKIYFHGAKEGHKIDAIKACDKVSFCTWDEGYRKDDDWALNSVCSTKPLPKSRTTLDTRGERLRCFEFDEMDGI